MMDREMWFSIFYSYIILLSDIRVVFVFVQTIEHAMSAKVKKLYIYT